MTWRRTCAEMTPSPRIDPGVMGQKVKLAASHYSLGYGRAKGAVCRDPWPHSTARACSYLTERPVTAWNAQGGQALRRESRPVAGLVPGEVALHWSRAAGDGYCGWYRSEKGARKIDRSLLHGYAASSGERVLAHKCHLGKIDLTVPDRSTR